MSMAVIDRLRTYYVMEGGKPWFSNKTKVHRAADLHGAVETMAIMHEALSWIVEHRTEKPCASAWEKDARTLVEVQEMAKRALTMIGGDA
jgi:hypothetical protein